MKVFLETDRLILRQFTDADENNLFELDSDPEVVRFFPGIEVNREKIRTFIQAVYSYYEEYDGYGFWAVEEKSTDQFIGWFLFRPIKKASYFNPDISDPDDVELGYRFIQSSWGKGYATEGSKALIFKGFNELSVNCIMAGAVSENKASLKVMEKSGLKLQGRFFEQEIAKEVTVYSLKKHVYFEKPV